MIDWDIQYIEEIQHHYNEVFDGKLNLIYLIHNFEQIYRLSLRDKILLPDLFQDIMLYTFNGVNARDKFLYSDKEIEIIDEFLEEERIKQRQRRDEAISNGLDDYYNFLQDELRFFVKEYPFWSRVFEEKK